ncbi:MAG: DUF1622 domain-containing protein [Ilumatobacter sp.]
MEFETLIQHIGEGVEIVGVFVMVIGIVWALGRFAIVVRSQPDAYAAARRSIGRSILLGLEILVAGDIVRTVAISPTLTSVAVLGAIVVIRTFLSFALEVELEGRWPWQQRADSN